MDESMFTLIAETMTPLVDEREPGLAVWIAFNVIICYNEN